MCSTKRAPALTGFWIPDRDHKIELFELCDEVFQASDRGAQRHYGCEWQTAFRDACRNGDNGCLSGQSVVLQTYPKADFIFTTASKRTKCRGRENPMVDLVSEQDDLFAQNIRLDLDFGFGGSIRICRSLSDQCLRDLS